ncbi:MAG: zinc-binding alcohol dehydrogenase family protein [Candidatus Poribacteria bacterium]|nr:zinc-binding alcohol dehydrogenase family protein [Candidatus Poribacteria bacterium]
MKTIVLDEPGRFSLTDTAAPNTAPDGHALVKVHRVGICGTDLHAFRGKQPFFTYPRILGHELGVEVVEIGANDLGIKPGDSCAVEPYLNCGACIACRRGRTNCCVKMQVLGVHTDGGMRETIAVPVSKLHKSVTMSQEQLALVETLSIGCHAVARAGMDSDETVLVIGAGPIGLTVVQFALLEGVRVLVMDVNEQRLAFCRKAFGVETLRADQEPLERLKELTNGDLPTTVFDATGNPKSMEQAIYYVAHGGRLVFVGFVQDNLTFRDQDVHAREMTVLRTRNATSADFRRVMSLIESGEIDTSSWVTHRASVESMIAEFPTWLDPASGTIKAVVAFAD